MQLLAAYLMATRLMVFNGEVLERARRSKKMEDP